jgi:hypothetical protein
MLARTPAALKKRHAGHQARLRQRQRNGRAVFRLEANHDLLVLALLESRRLTEGEALERERVEAALAAVLEQWARRWKK